MVDDEFKLPYVNLRQATMEKQYSSRATARIRVSTTLGELLKWVEDGTANSSHQIIELTDFNTSLGSISHPYPFVLSFHNLTYSVKIHKNKTPCPDLFTHGSSTGSTQKLLLNNISGEAREGEIMAVLGASGSGKSTLIDALADRISKDSLKGEVRLNGEVFEAKMLKVISAYVMQDDLLFPMLTVEETLMFSAEFRLPRMLSKSKKAGRVQALIDQLGLRSAL